jgi:hypothetical protein
MCWGYESTKEEKAAASCRWNMERAMQLGADIPAEVTDRGIKLDIDRGIALSDRSREQRHDQIQTKYEKVFARP